MVSGRRKVEPRLRLERFEGNPILEPKPEHPWESKAVFNPAALYLAGKVHLAYRALGDTDVSVLGYASSTDGFHIEERLDKPMYVPREPFEGAVPARSVSGYASPFMSGGGEYGGCEDPKMTQIGDRVYMAYVAYSGYSPPRVALSSIHVDDFLSKKWQWTKPILISRPGVVDKNPCLFPGKIGGKYVIFHRIYPDILIDFVDDLDFDGTPRWLKDEFKISPRASYWDSNKLGAGASPIKTEKGWLLIYHAIDTRDPLQYKIGAMLLDLKDPTKVLARFNEPLLEPQERYENEGWKSGVVYPGGAVVIGNTLLVYYGGADKFVCVAWAKLDEFMERLVGARAPEPYDISAPSRETVTATVTPIEAEPKPAYCVKCRAVREIKNPRAITMKNGRPATQGVCPVCGTKIFQIRSLNL